MVLKVRGLCQIRRKGSKPQELECQSSKFQEEGQRGQCVLLVQKDGQLGMRLQDVGGEQHRDDDWIREC